MIEQRRVIVVGYDRVNGFDLMGPVEVLSTANHACREGEPYAIVVAAPAGRPFRTESGMTMVPEVALEDAPPGDTIVVPGGFGVRDPATNRVLAGWLSERLGGTRRVTTVCTGIYALAPTGALDGRKATTHWQFIGDVARKYPAIEMVGAAVYVRDGPICTSGGIASGVDMALSLVAEDLGAKLAAEVAEYMVIQSIRGERQGQVSAAMRAQTQAADRLSGLLAWIGANLDAPLEVEALAERAALSPRQLHRLFLDELGETPARYVLARRLDAARDLLSGGMSVEAAAAATGFASADTFRRAFARTHGAAPSRFVAEIVG